jgi:hypothetical protein
LPEALVPQAHFEAHILADRVLGAPALNLLAGVERAFDTVIF